MKIKKLLLASALLFSAYNVSAQTQVIAHRGFWKTGCGVVVLPSGIWQG